MIKLSIIGLYNYDNTLFDNMYLPDDCDPDLFIDRLFMEAGELSVCYPDAVLMKRLITNWSAMKLPQWERLKTVIDTQYNVIQNYDRTESETYMGSDTTDHTGTVRRENSDARTRTSNRDISDKDTGTVTDVMDKDTTSSGSGSRSNTQTRNAADTKSATGFNSAALQTTEKLDMTGTIGDAETTTDSTTGTDDTTTTRTLNTTKTVDDDVSESDYGTATGTDTLNTRDALSKQYSRTSTVSGNIGVTTSQQMLQQEIDLIPQLDLYGTIVNDFIDCFCVGVY